jgi:hypothetical protein
MHVVTCTIAIAGDQNNKFVKKNVTAAELALLQILHGHDSVTDLKITGRKRIDQRAERDRLMLAYPNQQKVISELWRDHGGKLPVDVRDLNMKSAQLARDEDLNGPSAYKDPDAAEVGDDVPDRVDPVPSVSRGAKAPKQRGELARGELSDIGD